MAERAMVRNFDSVVISSTLLFIWKSPMLSSWLYKPITSSIPKEQHVISNTSIPLLLLGQLGVFCKWSLSYRATWKAMIGNYGANRWCEFVSFPGFQFPGPPHPVHENTPKDSSKSIVPWCLQSIFVKSPTSRWSCRSTSDRGSASTTSHHTRSSLKRFVVHLQPDSASDTFRWKQCSLQSTT